MINDAHISCSTSPNASDTSRFFIGSVQFVASSAAVPKEMNNSMFFRNAANVLYALGSFLSNLSDAGIFGIFIGAMFPL